MKVSAIVTVYQRLEQTLATLEKLRGCQPPPEEILVHIDGNQTQCEEAIRRVFPGIKIIVSQNAIGPGGGRNKLVAAARNELVASFDDDSYPIDADYFARVVTLFEKFPEASILGAAVYHQGEVVADDSQTAEWVADFAGGGCAYRRAAFLATAGYVPLSVAYGMEEVDLALRVHAQQGHILRTRWLRVFHDTDLRHHSDPRVTAGSIANLALLAYLRYPRSLWIMGFWQCCNRVRWLVMHGRFIGVLDGLLNIPVNCWRHRRYRKRLKRAAVKSYVKLRRAPTALEPFGEPCVEQSEL